MITSPTPKLFEPKGNEKLAKWTLAYFRARLKYRIFSLIMKEFKASGLSKADLARRLDKEPAQLSRLLSGPGNLTLETISDFLFAIGGAELSAETVHPLRAPESTANPLRNAAPINNTSAPSTEREPLNSPVERLKLARSAFPPLPLTEMAA